MTRQYNYRKSAPSRKEEAYAKALAKLRRLQEDAEQPENRYICPCISAAGSKDDSDRLAEAYTRFMTHLYPDGLDKPPCPIDPANVTPNEILLRMLAQDGTTADQIRQRGDFSCVKEQLTDGYVRWEPPRTLPRSQAGWHTLTQRVGRHIAQLEDRRKDGYGSTATPCEDCPAGKPEREVFQTGIMGASAYLCEIARAQTAEDIEISNANLETQDLAGANIWALKPPET